MSRYGFAVRNGGPAAGKTYEEVVALFTARSPLVKTVGNNTQLHRDSTEPGEPVSLRLHITDIITWYPDGRIVLNSGRWRTMTTKARINAWLPGRWSLYADKGEWFLSTGDWHSDDARYEFADGMTLHPDGSVTGAIPVTEVKARAALRKRIAAYADAYAEKLVAGEVPPPSGGDCWLCLVTPSENGPGTGHLQDHLDEQYYVPSLLTRAMEATADTSELPALVRGTIHTLWYLHGEAVDPAIKCSGLSDWTKKLTRDSVAALIRKYLQRAFGLAVK